MPPKKEDKNKDEKNKNENNKDKEKRDKKKVPEKLKKVGEGVTVGIIDKPNRCFPETPKQLECPTRSSIPSYSCPPPNCCEIHNYYPEETQDCSAMSSCNPKKC